MVGATPVSTVDSLLRQGRQALAVSAAEPYLEAQILLAAVLKQPRSHLLAHPDAQVGLEAEADYRKQLAARCRGKPIAYILGHREFWSLDLIVSADTLIPRAETELLVETALAVLPERPSRVLDLGTGSGAVALAIKSERPDTIVTAVDVDAAALAVARANGSRLGLAVEWLESDWFTALAGRQFDVIVSNPPYVACRDPHLDEGDLAFEPRHALEAGTAGLDALRTISAAAIGYLRPGGDLLLEHGYDQAAAVRDCLSRAGFEAVSSYRDLLRQERVTAARAPETTILEMS
jgi:release factor glutamine methyltransferase